MQTFATWDVIIQEFRPVPPPRNFRLADLVTIMNGVCGSLSIFSSARYLLTNDPDYLWTAMAFPLAGLMFDFLDGKVARWRKSSSMLGQELDSLADLVCISVSFADLGLKFVLDFLWSRSGRPCIRRWPQDISGHRCFDGIYLLRSCPSGPIQCDSGFDSEEWSWQSKVL